MKIVRTKDKEKAWNQDAGLDWMPADDFEQCDTLTDFEHVDQLFNMIDFRYFELPAPALCRF